MSSSIDRSIAALRDFVASWPGGVRCLEVEAQRVAHDLTELHAVAASKAVRLPKAYVDFMTRYGSLTLVPTELPTSPLDGFWKWSVAAPAVPCLLQLLARRGFGPPLSLRPAFERATRGKTGAALVDATVAALRQVVDQHPNALLLVEALPQDPKQCRGPVVAALGEPPDEHFVAYHKPRLGAWQRSKAVDTRVLGQVERLCTPLPPSYRHFLERFGSLTLLADRLAPWIEGFWAGNRSSNGWALLEVLDAKAAVDATQYIRTHASENDVELQPVFVMHGGWMGPGFALHLGSANQAGECAVQSISDDAVGDYAFEKLPRSERVATDFAAWLAGEARRIIDMLEVGLGKQGHAGQPRI